MSEAPSIFRPHMVFLELPIDATYVVILKYWIKSKNEMELCATRFLEWRTSGAKGPAPLRSGGSYRTAVAQVRHSAPVSGAELLLQSAQAPPVATGAANRSNEKAKLETELLKTRKAISDLAKTIEDHNRLLAPYWYRKGDIEDGIKRTHGRCADGAILFQLAGAPARKSGFEELMELAIEWGPVKTERAELQIRVKAHEREVRKIETELKYLAKKKGKKREQA